MSRTAYLVYGLLVLAAAGYGGHRGMRWFWSGADEVRNVPKSVRENPGSYRAHYWSTGRTRGGK